MADTFRRRCESALTLATFLASAWRCGSVVPGAFREGLVLLTAALLLILTACPTDHGITRVGTAEREVMAGALSTSNGVEGTFEAYSYFVSTDGGLTWIRAGQREEIEWSGDSVDTPIGVYRIDGPNVVLHLPSRTSEIVYSAGYLLTSSNRWFQAEETRHLGGRKLSSGPRSIAYDPHSGNILVAMGLQGLAVGTPDGRWLPIAVDQYSPTVISGSRKVLALSSDWHFWVAVFTFPWSMIAIAIVIGVPVKKSDDVLVPAYQIAWAWPCLFCSILISASFLVTLGGYDETPGNLSGVEIFLIPLWVLSVATALLAAAIAWWGQRRVPWRALVLVP